EDGPRCDNHLVVFSASHDHGRSSRRDPPFPPNPRSSLFWNLAPRGSRLECDLPASAARYEIPLVGHKKPIATARATGLVVPRSDPSIPLFSPDPLVSLLFLRASRDAFLDHDGISNYDCSSRSVSSIMSSRIRPATLAGCLGLALILGCG